MLILKTLVIVSHPEINNSQTQQFLMQGAKMQDVTWHHVEELAEIDVAKEQALLKENDRIIFQFPLYWYAAPEGLKHWEDEVLTRNFVYGDGDDNLSDKEFGIVVSTGMPLKEFRRGGSENITIDQIMAPYYAIADRAKMNILPTFTIAQFQYMDEQQQMQLLIDYQRFLTQKYPDTLNNRQEWFEQEFTDRFKNFNDTNCTECEMVLNTFIQRREDLEQLKSTISLIKQGEDE
ncbi:NAD(P)H-dependent oxidoreductase [Companilactobacillus nantensis]|uniref:NADPH-quinone reductase (Modulator of drug activity B) n=1 Tax=Companilactobacillus nantensis DSM 16982 TaxID=1423774 RepID=A0A0R1W9M8_9LACO|nr:NAD(P)H-dependent oxidoreductase [Companilactobacillus nantensis]KRM14386.1 NADPH-quinone reductase (modulator of drug activity B) [Companilactobacillus nantensis DSM 16982]